MENLVREKFRRLGISQEQFKKLPVAEREARLRSLEDEVSNELAREREYAQHLMERYREVNLLRRETEERLRTLESTAELIRIRTEEYRSAVHEERVCIARIAAYTRWYRRARERLDVLAMRRYAIRIAAERERLPELRERVAELREELRRLPRIWTVTREIEEQRRLLSLYERRLATLYETHTETIEKIGRLEALLKEIQEEIPVVITVRHKYREVNFEVLKALEYSARKTGSDIDIEVSVAGTLKTLLPTKYEDNECGWLSSIEPVLRNTVCDAIDYCIESEDGYGLPLPPEVGIRCNVVGIEITKRTVIDATKRYENLEPPLTDEELMSRLEKELEKHSFITITSVIFRRSYTLGEEKERKAGAEDMVRRCITRRTSEILEELIRWTVSEELPALKERLTRG